MGHSDIDVSVQSKKGKLVTLLCGYVTSLVQRSEEGRFFLVNVGKRGCWLLHRCISSEKKYFGRFFLSPPDSWWQQLCEQQQVSLLFLFPGCTTLYHIARNKSAIQLHFHQESLWQKQCLFLYCNSIFLLGPTPSIVSYIRHETRNCCW